MYKFICLFPFAGLYKICAQEMNKVILFSMLMFAANILHAQLPVDTISPIVLSPVEVHTFRPQQDIQRLDAIQGTYIFSGKKNEVIDLTQKNAALGEKYGRQIFAKITGVFVYDMDGTGNQINISTRGLDAHRGWEYNIRKDGVITNSDMYGYPASHYNIPLEAVKKIELVRGTGSLQYGAQFGGMINYVSKEPDSTKTFELENFNTVGSYGLYSNFIRVAGSRQKFRYNIWFNKKSIDGYRENGDSKSDAQNISLWFIPNSKWQIKAELTRSSYLTHIPGPLTDSLFRIDPTQSTRSRNYYSPEILVPSIHVKWNLNKNTKFEWTTSAVLGSRSSVMFDKPANVPDSKNPSTGNYANRQVDIDQYNSYTTEIRTLRYYLVTGKPATLVGGIQYMNNDLHRRQQGKGTVGSDYNLALAIPGWGRDLNYATKNIAAFVENRFTPIKNLQIHFGGRIESGETRMTGAINNYPDELLDNVIKHQFPLFGGGFQYDINSNINIYGGWSQAYRPVIFKDIIPGSLYEVSDKNLKDARGYNAETGIRGRYKFLKWDVSLFALEYKNRLGTIATHDSTGQLIIYRTNIGDSFTQGIECFIEANFALNNQSGISLFTSTSYMDARYKNAIIRSGNQNVDISDKQVESVPSWISRNGMTFKYNSFQLSILYSYVAESFADALNAVETNESGSVGLVPSYQLLDMNTSVSINDHLTLQLNVNNIFDENYFTKRPQFYPGPGIWPSDDRTFSGTLMIRI